MLGSFPPLPQFSGCILYAPRDARAFFYNDLRFNDTCSIIGGCITYWKAQTERSEYPLILLRYSSARIIQLAKVPLNFASNIQQLQTIL